MHVAESALGLMVDGGAVLETSGIDGGGASGPLQQAETY